VYITRRLPGGVHRIGDRLPIACIHLTRRGRHWTWLPAVLTGDPVAGLKALSDEDGRLQEPEGLSDRELLRKASREMLIAIRLVSGVLPSQLPHLMATKTMETATLLNALSRSQPCEMLPRASGVCQQPDLMTQPPTHRTRNRNREGGTRTCGTELLVCYLRSRTTAHDG
jgi:hypothetical protein